MLNEVQIKINKNNNRQNKTYFGIFELQMGLMNLWNETPYWKTQDITETWITGKIEYSTI